MPLYPRFTNYGCLQTRPTENMFRRTLLSQKTSDTTHEGKLGIENAHPPPTKMQRMSSPFRQDGDDSFSNIFTRTRLTRRS